MRWEGRKTLRRKVLRRASRAGEVVGWKVGRGPGGLIVSSCSLWGVGWGGQYRVFAAWVWL